MNVTDWPVDDETTREYCNRRWEELRAQNPDLCTDAVEFLRRAIPDEVLAKIRTRLVDPAIEDWTTDWNDSPLAPFHFTQGMAIRNLLRTEAGILDSELPSVHGWDDYYTPALEEAATTNIL